MDEPLMASPLKPQKIGSPLQTTPRLKIDFEVELAKEKETDPEMTVQQLRALYFSSQMIQNLREKYLRQDLV